MNRLTTTILLSGALLTAAVATPQYRIVVPQPIAGDLMNHTITCINDRGEMGGAALVGTTIRPFRITSSGISYGTQNIATNYFNTPEEISESGIIFGTSSYNTGSQSAPFVWKPDSNPTYFTPVLNSPIEQAVMGNDAGDMLGYANGGSSILWHADGSKEYFSGNYFFSGMTNDKKFYGERWNGSAYVPVLWPYGGNVLNFELGSLGSATITSGSRSATYFAGDSASSTGVVWNASGQKLHQFALGASIANRVFVNDRMDVVYGTQAFINDEYVRKGVYWSPLTGPIELTNMLTDEWAGWTVTGVNDINSSGQIVASVQHSSFQYDRYVLLNPVPEPATLLALGAGLAGILSRRKRHREG